MKKIILMVTLALIITSCGKSNSTSQNGITGVSQTLGQSIPTNGNSIDTNVAVSRLGLLWSLQFTSSVVNHLSGPALSELNYIKINNEDLRSLGCPRFNDLSQNNKTTFWIYFISAIADVESGYQSNFIFWDREHKFTAGLLLISKGVANQIVSPQTGRLYDRGDLLNYDTNIEVGLHILRRQLLGAGDTRGEDRGHLFTRETFMWPSLSYRRDLVISAFNKNASKMAWCR